MYSGKYQATIIDMKYFYITFFSLFLFLDVNAAVSFTAKAPAVVSTGEQFRLQYTINTSVNTEPHIPSISGFRIVYGPAVSTSQSYQSINGHVTQSSSTSFTYTLIAEKEGSFTLPSAAISFGGRTYMSNRPHVKVVKSGSGARRATSQNNRIRYSSSGADADYHKINPSDLYITTTASKHEVYEQEPILLSYNVYTNLMLEQLQGKMPDLKGFVAKEIPMSKDKHLTVTRHNGRTTQTTVWSQYVMFPQQSGQLTIPSIKFDGVIAFPNRNVDPVDAFFFGSNAITRVNHSVSAPAVSITVKPLPTSPAGFGGAVGRDFNISAKMLTKDIRENETFNLQVVVSGTGNIDLISPPEVEFPVDFETYDPVANVKTELTANGLTGQLLVNYSATPNHKGTFVIPPVKFVYFNPQDASYHTISTGKAIRINVGKGNPNSFAARQRLRNDDIRDIHLDDVEPDVSGTFWLGLPFWLAYAVLFILLLFRTAIIRLARKLPKQGIRRLSGKDSDLALPQCNEPNVSASEYCGRLLAAFKQFIADRTDLPAGEPSREQVREALLKYNVEDADIDASMEFMDKCGMYAYGATGSMLPEMNVLHNQACELMKKLKKQLKKRKCKKTQRRAYQLVLLLAALLAFNISDGHCQTKNGADSLYLHHHYDKALWQYNMLLKKYPQDYNLLYNAGNCYYRLKKIPEAILSYERAVRYSPSDRDLRHNLTMARAQTADKFYSATDLELIYSFNSFVNILSTDGWAMVSVLCLLAVVCCAYFRRLSGNKLLRKGSLVMIMLSATGLVLSNIFAFTQHRRFTDRSGAIIMTTTPLRSTPDTTGTAIFTLHGGTKVTLTDTTLPAWSEVVLSDGRKGWVFNKDKENI